MSAIRGLCQGRWPSLLTLSGIDGGFLTGNHGPCPICGGKDRFRFDDKEGNGTWICNHCGAGDGFDLLMRVKGWSFAEAASHLEGIVGKAEQSKPRQQISDDAIRKAMNNLWLGAKPIEAGDPVAAYLAGRGIRLDSFPASLRYAERCSYHHEGNRYTTHPAMIAMVAGPDGKPATLHRTYLAHGGRKADLPKVRMLMPGKIAKGSAVRLGPAGSILGIAEGVETALSAHAIYQVPVWAALSAGMLMQWQPPAEADEIWIFGDYDANFAGQSAAYALAHRLAHEGKIVKVQMPDVLGDWNDYLKILAA